MIQVNWEIRRFKELTLDQLYDLLKLRTDVFVVEQHCPYPELDGKDRHPETRHILARAGHLELAAYARVLGPAVHGGNPGFGRVVVNPGFRRRGLSHLLVEKAVSLVREQWPDRILAIGAQEYLREFYISHGFEPVSDTYLEDGIPHIDMILNPG